MKTFEHPIWTAVFANLLMPASCVFAAEPVDETLKPYLLEIAPGPQSAHEMLGLSHTVVNSLQAPQDWLGVLGASDRQDAKAGVGFAFTPGRSDIRALAVSAREYADERKWLHRLWGATTLSYAQNQAEYGGVNYRQQAFFLQTTYFIDAKEDPLVAGYLGVAKCTLDKEKSAEFNTELLRRLKEAKDAARRDNPNLTPAQMEQLFEKVESAAKDEAEKALAGPMAFLRVANKETRACAQKAMDAAAAKWNTSRVGLAIGQGWITGSPDGSQRLSLGRHVSLSAALALPGLENSLLNLTVRHAGREVDLQTLAIAPVYKSATQTALRFTYDAGTSRNVFVLAEVSSAKNNAATQSSTAFRQALGVDFRFSEGVWFELRHGRVREADGSGTQNKTVMNVKISGLKGVIPTLAGN